MTIIYIIFFNYINKLQIIKYLFIYNNLTIRKINR